MEIKYTPGPWSIKYVSYTRASIVAPTWNEDLAVVHIDGCAEGLANASLIAAAPELLDALCDMVSDRDCLSEATINFARAAIAKATGDK